MTARLSPEVRRKGLGLLLRIVREQPKLFLISFLGACLVVLVTIGSAFVIGEIVARVVVPMLDQGRLGAGSLALTAVILLGVSALKVAGIFSRRLGAVYTTQRLQAGYRKMMVRRYLRLPPQWHRRHAAGKLLAHAGSDVDATWSPAGSLAYAMATVLLLVTGLSALLLTDWALALIGVVVFPALFAVFALYSRTVAPRYRHAQALRGEVSAVAHESFDGALTVKVMGREEHETSRFAAKVARLRDVLIRIGHTRGWYDPVIAALPGAGTLAVLVVGAWRLEAGAIGLAELTRAAFLFALLDTPVRAIGWLLTALPRAVAGWDRINPVLEATGEMRYGTASPGAHRAELRFTGVTYRYPDREPALRDVSLHLPPGRVLAVTGATGSGKSTLAALAARLIDPEHGVVELNGGDIRQLSAAGLAGAVALVPQVPFAFDDTVRANVALDRAGIDDEWVWHCLALAQADTFVRQLSSGLDTRLGERGVTLSGGQRQRLTLARALAGQPRLLILDDATSALDPLVEAAVISGLRDRAGTLSLLLIATRRTTIELADQVVYLDRGRIAATGGHDELLAAVPGYAALVTAHDRKVPA